MCFTKAIGMILLQSFTKPFIWFGLAGLSILVLLAFDQ